jgi:hypothetical protein
MYYDGVMVSTMTLAGTSVSNDGDLYIGRDPWWYGSTGAGFDNVQIHNRALTEEEIKQVAAGHLLLNENCVLALDFAEGETDTHTVTDLSGQNNVVTVKGQPVMNGASYTVHETIDGGAYMTVDGVNDYLVIDHSESLALGKDGADFTVSFALLQTQEIYGWRSLLHKGNVDAERSPGIWKHADNTGIYSMISTVSGGSQGIENSAVLPLNEWVYYTYLKEGLSLTIFYNGVAVDEWIMSEPS